MWVGGRYLQICGRDIPLSPKVLPKLFLSQTEKNWQNYSKNIIPAFGHPNGRGGVTVVFPNGDLAWWILQKSQFFFIGDVFEVHIYVVVENECAKKSGFNHDTFSRLKILCYSIIETQDYFTWDSDVLLIKPLAFPGHIYDITNGKLLKFTCPIESVENDI